MKFRMIWAGSEDDPERQIDNPETDASLVVDRGEVRYEQTSAGMVRREGRGRHSRVVPLANFKARIVRDVVGGDDSRQSRQLGIEAEVAGQKVECMLPASEFHRMNWVLSELGPQAVVYPGQLQHARAAIQCLSTQIRRERMFTHLGWRKDGADWVYLHAGGGIGAAGSLADCQMQLPAMLQHYRLSQPAERGELVEAIRSSLRFLSIAPDRISLPLLAAVYRAPLGGVDFSVFLTGRTGSFKTALASLCQQHFGADLDAAHLPANFASTGNALEELAFAAKDTLLVVDDFAPTGGPGDNALHALTERLFRAVGNHQGRNRMGGYGKLHAARPPRSLILATGEDVPQGRSLRARLLIVKVGREEVDQIVLGQCQDAGSQGTFATAMAGYLAWIARRYDELQDRLRKGVDELPEIIRSRSTSIHARLPKTMAEINVGWAILLEFALETGAINRSEQRELQHRSDHALQEIAGIQRPYHQSSDPALRFLTCLRAVLTAGRAHVVDRQGRLPQEPEQWGWRRIRNRWAAQGRRIGWLASNDLFLDPVASYEAAQQMGAVLVSPQTLRRRLREHGLLASVDAGRQVLLVRRTLEGLPRQVVHLRTRDLVTLAGHTV